METLTSYCAHSGWRWVVLILLLVAIFKAFSGWKSKRDFTAGDKKIAMFAMIAFHLQWTVGLVMYFTSPKVAFVPGMMKDSMLRFFAIEHIFGMTLAMALLTIGYSKSKKLAESTAKFKKIFWFYFISLVIILATIPWPFRGWGNNWF
ncbi:MAG: cytochrome B [Crocinitomicaceae bacterium]|nr:cytochrome B [Crocinitomicaceae bacterium]